MGNAEGGHSRSPARAGSADTSRHQSKLHKSKSPMSQLVSPQQQISRDPSARTVFYDTCDCDTDLYHTCKSGLGTHSKDIPAYYFTASQLARAKNMSRSQDSDLNRMFAVGQKPDVRHILWSSLHREGDANVVSVVYLFHYI